MNQMRKNRMQDYSYRFTSVLHYAMTQVSLNRGLNQFKENGEKAVSKDLLQIYMKIIFIPLTAGGIPDIKKYEAL